MAKVTCFDYVNGELSVTFEIASPADAGAFVASLVSGQATPPPVAEPPKPLPVPTPVNRPPVLTRAVDTKEAGVVGYVAEKAQVERMVTPPLAAPAVQEVVASPAPAAAPVPSPAVSAPTVPQIAKPENFAGLKAAGSFKASMEWFIANGFTKADDIYDRCVAWKSEIPVIERAAGDLRERVVRSLEVLLPK